jgi:hypothetical protein
MFVKEQGVAAFQHMGTGENPASELGKLGGQLCCVLPAIGDPGLGLGPSGIRSSDGSCREPPHAFAASGLVDPHLVPAPDRAERVCNPNARASVEADARRQNIETM